MLCDGSKVRFHTRWFAMFTRIFGRVIHKNPVLNVSLLIQIPRYPYL